MAAHAFMAAQDQTLKEQAEQMYRTALHAWYEAAHKQSNEDGDPDVIAFYENQLAMVESLPVAICFDPSKNEIVATITPLKKIFNAKYCGNTLQLEKFPDKIDAILARVVEFFTENPTPFGSSDNLDAKFVKICRLV